MPLSVPTFMFLEMFDAAAGHDSDASVCADIHLLRHVVILLQGNTAPVCADIHAS